jgi:hypothetical protein
MPEKYDIRPAVPWAAGSASASSRLLSEFNFLKKWVDKNNPG